MLGLLVLFSVAGALVAAAITLAGIRFLTHPKRITFATMVAYGLPTSPMDLGFPFEERTLKARDGIAIPAWITQGQDAAGPICVMSHGWADSRFGSITPLQAIVPVVSQAWMYDLRGQGESPAPASLLGTTEVEDLLDILEVIAKEQPHKKVVLIGFSMGAGISIAAAARTAKEPNRYPDVIGVIGDGVYRLGMQPIEGYTKVNKLPRQPFMFLIKRHLMFWYASDEAFDRARHAQGLNCPLLLMHGDLDEICPLSAAREIAAAAPKARLEIFTDASHLDLYAREPDRYEDLIQRFVKKVAASEQPF
jgi:uncharacterized protein